MSTLLHIVFLALYGLYVFFKMDRTKPLPWLLAHMSVVGAGAWAAFTHSEIYALVSGGLTIAMAVKAYFVDKTPLSNWKSYASEAIQDFLFAPVSSFEKLYQWVATKVKLPTLPKV